MKAHAIFGPPGTGKTRYLEELIPELIKTTSNIAVLSFTRAAASVITSRLQRAESVRFIGTNHSLCFRELKLTRQQVAMVDKFIEWVNMDEKDVQWALGIGQYARRNGIRLDDAYVEIASTRMDCPYGIVEFICESYGLWKSDQCIVDFDDMLIKATGAIEPFDIVIVDEAQDLSKVQWKFIESITARDGKMFLAGDDDQSIFTWAGAHVHGMAEIADTHEVLDQSHRIPSTVHMLAERTINQITKRQHKQYSPRKEEGYVEILPDYNPLGTIRTRGIHTVLCRDWWTLKDIENELACLGIPYIIDTGKDTGPFNSTPAKIIRAISNEDFGYLNKHSSWLLPHAKELVSCNKIPDGRWTDNVNLERVPEEDIAYLDLVDLDADPQVILGTIHSFKGKEDDHIVLIGTCTEMVESAIDNPVLCDDEIRTWYVGLTRAKQGVTLVGSSSFIPL